MNLFDLHPDPETLKGYEQRFDVPEIAYQEAKKIYRKTKQRVPELEKAIAKDTETAYAYADQVIKGRFPEGETAIAKSAHWSYHYAFILRGRFHKGERTIAKDPHYSQLYICAFDVDVEELWESNYGTT